MSRPASSPFTASGTGFPVVFSHGSEMDRSMFDPQLDHLAASGFRAIAYDHRARTPNWQGPYSLYDLADDCRQLLDDLDIERCVLCGMSMGGFMALRFALRYPERAAGLVLLAGAMCRSYTHEEYAEWEASYVPLLEEPTVPLAWARSEAELCFSEETRRANPELVEHWIRRWAANDGPAVRWEARAWMDQDDITDALVRLTTPVLIIHGNDDEAVPITEALQTFQLVPDARMIRLPGAGHTVNLERPEIVSRAIEQFAAEITSDL